MKKLLVVLQVSFILCLCIGKICSEAADQPKNEDREKIRNQIKGASEQFIDDVMAMNEKCKDDIWILLVLLSMSMSEKQNSKFDVNDVKEYLSTQSFFKRENNDEVLMQLDNLKLDQSKVSRQLPPERYNGFFNLVYTFTYPNATSEEIGSALNYLYGIDTAATKTSFLMKLPDITPSDCPDESKKHSNAIDGIKSMIEIRPKVIQDLNSIYEKFPCNRISFMILNMFERFFTGFRGDEVKIDACMIIEHSKNRAISSNLREEIEAWMKVIESIWQTRLADETFRGLINALKASIPGTPIDETQKALEYLYDDVPKTNCSS